MHATMESKQTVGETIKAARMRAGLTQDDLAKRAGVTQAALSRIESGKREPTLSTMKVIASALGVTVKDLIPDE